MNKQKAIKISLIVIGIIFLMGISGFVVLLFIPAGGSNPPIVTEPNWDSPRTRALAERACFDCHSNETKWPWYSKIPPFSQTIAHEVREGRETLNFSDWRPNRENESIETILEGEMPPRNYLLLHPEARLTNAETKALIAGFKATFGNSGEGEHELGENEDEEGERESRNDD